MSSSAGKDVFNYLIYFSKIFLYDQFLQSIQGYILHVIFLQNDSLEMELFEQNVIMFTFEHIFFFFFFG